MSTSNAYPKPGAKLEDHPISQIFPIMGPEDRAALETSIKEHGQREPIMLLEGKILDGRNRFEACRAIGIEPTFEFYNYRVHGASPTAYVMDRNFTRRHLTTGQKAAIAAEALPFYQAEAAERQRKSGVKHAENLKQHKGDPESQETGHDPAEESQEHKAKGAGGSGQARNTPPPAAKPKTTPPASKPAADKPEAKPAADKPKEKPAATAKAPKAPPAKKTPPAPAPEPPKGRATEIAAASAGVSETAVKTAAKLQSEDPKGFEAVKKGETSLNAAAAKLSAKQKAQQAYDDALTRVGNIAGKSLVEAHKEGVRLKGKKELIAYAALDDAKMIEIRGLIEDGWQVAKALKYKTKTLGRTHSIGDLVTRAAQAGGIFTLELGEWEIMVTRKK